MHPGRADLEITGAASDHDRQADRLESFARPMTLAALYLQSELEDGAAPPPASGSSGDLPDAKAFRQRLAHWFREGLVAGSDPASPHYWGPDASYHQHHVEMGLMSIALQLAGRDLWEPLTQPERIRSRAGSRR